MLLYRKGCDSFDALRTVDNVVCKTFREACELLGFCDNDDDVYASLNEAINHANSFQLRDLFALILLNCHPNKPGKLWEDFKQYMADDILYDLRKINENILLNHHIYNLFPILRKLKLPQIMNIY